MLYTVGHTELYLDFIDSEENPEKIGRDTHIELNQPEYKGGIAFETVQEAKEYLILVEKEDEWSVFGLDCTTDNTYYLDLDNTYRIIKNTRLIKL